MEGWARGLEGEVYWRARARARARKMDVGVYGTESGSTGGTVRSHSTPQHFTLLHREPSICFITSASALAQMVINPPNAMYSSVLI